MPTVRIMPCLDIKNGRVVKGVHFTALQDAGDPLTAARAYAAAGAAELVMLFIAAGQEDEADTLALIRAVADVPGLTLTVGGGINSPAVAESVIKAGAHRVSISSAAVRHPSLIDETAKQIGTERLVVAIDADTDANMPSGYVVTIDGGKTRTDRDVVAWAKEAQRRGAGMLLVTSKAADGAKRGYDLPLLDRLKTGVSIPVIASGGAGTMDHFVAAAEAGAEFLLAASVFHFGEIDIKDLQAYLQEHGFATE